LLVEVLQEPGIATTLTEISYYPLFPNIELTERHVLNSHYSLTRSQAQVSGTMEHKQDIYDCFILKSRKELTLVRFTDNYSLDNVMGEHR
jgi:hypothetical protein